MAKSLDGSEKYIYKVPRRSYNCKIVEKCIDLDPNWQPPAPPEWVLKLKKTVLAGFTPVIEIRPQIELVEVGEYFEMVLLQRFQPSNDPSHVFGISKLYEQYVKMEHDMEEFFSNVLHRLVIISANELMKGMMVIFYTRIEKDKSSYKRAKIVKNCEPDGEDKFGKSYVTIYLVDTADEIRVPSDSVFYWMNPKFAMLPARAYTLKMDGSKWYENSMPEFHRLMNPESGLWTNDNDTVDIVLMDIDEDEDKKIYAVFTDTVPQTEYPYGVMDFIIRRLSVLLYKPMNDGDEIKDAYVMRAEETGELILHFESPFKKHLEDFRTFLERKKDTIIEMAGKMDLPVKKGEIFLALTSYNGGFRLERARILNDCYSLSNPMKVRFIDLGKNFELCLAGMVLAKDIHPFLSVIPPMARSVFLHEAEYLDTMKLQNILPPNQSTSLSVVGHHKSGRPIVKLYNFIVIKGGRKVLQLNFEGSTQEVEGIEVDLKQENQSKWKIVGDEKTIQHDIISENGLGNECLHLKVGRELYFKACNVDKDKIFSVYPLVTVREQMKMFQILDKDYNETTNFDLHPSCWKPGYPFMVSSKGVNQIARGVFLRPDPSSDKKEILLIDLGKIESIFSSQCKPISKENSVQSAYGCLATIKKDGKALDAKLITQITMCKCFLAKVTSAFKGKYKNYEGINFAHLELQLIRIDF